MVFHPGDFMSVTEVARVLACSRKHVYYLIARGIIPAVRFGALVRVHRETLQTTLTNLLNAVEGREP